SDKPSAIFSYRLTEPIDWLSALGSDVFARAERGAFVTAIPAGKWTEGAAYAVIAPIEAWNGTAIVVALREDVPFDALAASGAKMVLRGAVSDERFHGVDPEAREAIVMPLRDGTDILGVLNVKRPEAPDGFADRIELLDAIAADIGRALRSVKTLGTLERERDDALAYADVASAVAANDVGAALDATLRLGHH